MAKDLTTEEKVKDLGDEIFDQVYPRIQALENQVRDLQQLVLNLKMYPPIQYIPPQQVPMFPAPYPGWYPSTYPLPVTITYCDNTGNKVP